MIPKEKNRSQNGGKNGVGKPALTNYQINQAAPAFLGNPPECLAIEVVAKTKFFNHRIICLLTMQLQTIKASVQPPKSSIMDQEEKAMHPSQSRQTKHAYGGS
mgnify:CR=1 FL=1